MGFSIVFSVLYLAIAIIICRALYTYLGRMTQEKPNIILHMLIILGSLFWPLTIIVTVPSIYIFSDQPYRE